MLDCLKYIVYDLNNNREMGWFASHKEASLAIQQWVTVAFPHYERDSFIIYER